MPLGREIKSARGEEEATHGLELLALLGVEGAGLHGNDFGSGVRVVGNGGAALGAEDAVDVVARGALARPLLDGAAHDDLVLWYDGHESCFSIVIRGEESFEVGGRMLFLLTVG